MGWPIVIICVLIAAMFYMRMKARADKDRREPDAGIAILDFGRAFPDEAIRAIHATADEKAYFVRLHDARPASWRPMARISSAISSKPGR